MSSLWAMSGLAEPDPLVIVFGLYAVGIIASRLFFRNYPVGLAVLRVIFLILLTAALLHAKIIPYEPLETSGVPLLDIVHAVLKSAWWLWAAWFFVGLSHATFRFERHLHEGKLLRDLISGFIYVAATLAIITYVFDLPIKGLLATSGVIAIILGLALQSTLGDVFSGIVLNFSRPYGPGDWVNIGGETSGRIIEINWRATHLLTAQRDLAIIPNSTIAKAKIVNLSYPSGVHGATITVQVAPGRGPSVIAALLDQAILNCRLILQTPAPSVTVQAMTAMSIDFEIDFFVRDLASASRAQNELHDLVYRHLTLAGIGLASPVAPPPVSPDTGIPGKARSRAELLLDHVDLFASLPAEERSAIAAKLKLRRYRQGEKPFAPDVVPHSLCFVSSGVMSYTRDSGIEEELWRLGPADHFGEIGLLTGAAAAVSVTAMTPVVVYELSRDDLAPVLEAHPEIAEALNSDLAQRQQTIQPPARSEVADLVSPPGLRGRLVDWFHRRYAAAVQR
jgi:small-conductance mechanosensitive channel/CRP-like cAMP-binding protein